MWIAGTGMWPGEITDVGTDVTVTGWDAGTLQPVENATAHNKRRDSDHISFAEQLAL